MVIELVTANKLKKDVADYTITELMNMQPKEIDKYVESLIIDLFGNYKNGSIESVADPTKINKAADELDYLSNNVKSKFGNIDAVIQNRKFRYMRNAYYTSYLFNMYRESKKMNLVLFSYLTTFYEYLSKLRMLLDIYYCNYSNRMYLNDLMFNLVDEYDLPVTF